MATGKYVEVYFSPAQEHLVTDLMGFVVGRGLRMSGELEIDVNEQSTAGVQSLEQAPITDLSATSSPDATDLG